MNEILEIFQKINMTNKFFPIVGPAVFAFALIFDREKLHIKLDGIAKFIALLVLCGTIKIALWDGNYVQTNPYGFSLIRFLFVIFEDAYFVMIPYYITNRIENKKINTAIWVVASILFASGHAYQGLAGVVVTSLYPYFLSNKYAKRTSFGTVMACHFLYDMFTVLLPKINNLLAYMRY